jgi:hypothetical protein
MSDRKTGPAGRINAVARAARAWRDPGHPARVEAVNATLEAPNRFTEEALAFAVNAAMHGLSAEALRTWIGARSEGEAGGESVAVLPGATGPLAGLRAVLAVVLAGHRCVFLPPEASPALMSAFEEAAWPEEDVFDTAQTKRDALDGVGAAVGGGDDEARADFDRSCAEAGVPAARRCWRGARFSVALIDGGETEDALEGLAEDALLHEGRGSVRLVWAAAGTAPDLLLEAMARFRAVFPAHPDTPGALRMQKAFLEARDQSYGHGEGLEFLMSRGAPEVQAPGHLRWAEYEALGEVRDWLAVRATQVHAVVARQGLQSPVQPPAALPVLAPGTVHRQFLDAPGAHDVLHFVAGL